MKSTEDFDLGTKKKIEKKSKEREKNFLSKSVTKKGIFFVDFRHRFALRLLSSAKTHNRRIQTQKLRKKLKKTDGAVRIN